MLARTYHARVYSWLAALSLAAYGVFGVFGHSLHGLMPLAKDCCGFSAATGDEHCCCGHEHAFAATARTAPQVDGVAVESAPSHHDASTCSLCVFLAKMKVGHAALETSETWSDVSCELAARCETRVLADVPFAFAARGPPAC